MVKMKQELNSTLSEEQGLLETVRVDKFYKGSFIM